VFIKKYSFEWEGSHPAADFVNTFGDRLSSNPLERLDSYEALIEFIRQSHLIDNNTAARLLKSTNTQTASEVLSEALQLREALLAILIALHSGKNPSVEDISRIGNWFQLAQEARRLTISASHLTWTWRDPNEPARPLWELAIAIESLLLSIDLRRIRKCAADDCGFIFVDNSRAGSRRWCSMTACGNRNKVRKFRSFHHKTD